VRVYNLYIISLSGVLLLTTVILAGIGSIALDVYYIAYVLEALVITELFVYLNKKARRGLGIVSAVLFGGFIVIVALEVIRILS
jgi:hypothetical protein